MPHTLAMPHTHTMPHPHTMLGSHARWLLSPENHASIRKVDHAGEGAVLAPSWWRHSSHAVGLRDLP